MRIARFIAVTLAAAALSACQAPGPTAVYAVDAVDDSYAYDGVSWDLGAQQIFFYKLKQIEGLTAVCGAQVVDDAGYAGAALVRKYMIASSLNYGEERIVTNLNFFNTVKGETAPENLSANCVKTDLPWVAGYENSRRLNIKGPNWIKLES